MSIESDSSIRESTLNIVMSSSAHQSKKDRNSATRRSDQICHFFSKQGSCKKGNSCLYLHEKVDHEALNTESVNPSRLSQSPTGSKQHRKECQVYRQSGSCRFGNNCRFLHIKPHDEALNKTSRYTSQTPVDKKRTNKEPRPCVSYERNGRCRYGKSCRYVHIDPEVPNNGQTVNSETFLTTHKDEVKKQSKSTGVRPANGNGSEPQLPQRWGKKYQQHKLCRYFKAGRCSMEDRCKFWHPQNLPDVIADLQETEDAQNDEVVQLVTQDVVTSESVPQTKSRLPVRPVVQRTSEYIVEVLSDETARQLRVTEMDLLEKRYPKAERTVDGRYRLVFIPTDPDWPYDVRELNLEVSFPDLYPKECLSVSALCGECLPETVRRCVSRSIDSWVGERYSKLHKRGRVELIFRSFLRWLDRNLEDLFTEGLKVYQKELMAQAAGVQFITAEELQEKYASAQQQSSSEGSVVSGDESTDQEKDEEDVELNDPRPGDNEEKENTRPSNTITDPAKRGTEVKLHNLQLKESAATLAATKISLVIQCGRCKNTTDISTPPQRLNSVACNRCNGTQLVTFRATLVHQFSSVLGYLDMVECSAFDLILSECSFKVGCMGCSKEMVMEGLPPGQPKDTWCRHCHEKMRIAAETTRFLVLQPSAILEASKAHVIDVKSTKKVAKDPAIQLGQPLPQNGTCRHYKKSFRWLRFPCCGKAYPCDVCHDENELDHDMKYASRMICGFCCKEQPYSSTKPCSGCENFMTKKSSAHWEGGKGCRDQIKMSRGDQKKYTSSSKTQSKSAQKRESNKRTTKLRHT